MPINPTEQATADYLLTLPPAEREAAAKRINQLVRAQAEPDDSRPKPPVHTLDEYLAHKIETPPFLITGGQLARGEITATVARAGKGKTTLGMNRMVRWAAGRPLFDDLTDSQAPIEPIKILMIENEGVASFMQEKLGILLNEGAGLNQAERELAGQNMLIWGDGGYSGLKIDQDADLELIRQACEQFGPDAILLEPFRGIWRGDENDSTAMEDVLDRLTQMGHDFGVGIMLAHHERKSGAGDDGEWMSAARGSAVLEAKCAVMENYRDVKGGLYRELSWSKNRFDTKAAPVRMIFDHNLWRLELVPTDDVENAILGLMSEDPAAWFWVAETAEALDESERKVRDAFNDLADDGRVVKKKGTDERRGYRYRLKTSDGDDRPGLDFG